MALFDLATAKLLKHRIVQKTFGVSALYEDSATNGQFPITVRFHSAPENADLGFNGSAEFLQSVDRVVFDQVEARDIDVKRNGVVTIAQYNITLRLDNRQKSNTNFEEVWEVSRS